MKRDSYPPGTTQNANRNHHACICDGFSENYKQIERVRVAKFGKEPFGQLSSSRGYKALGAPRGLSRPAAGAMARGITVLMQHKKVGARHGSEVNVRIDANWWVLKKRRKGESDEAMEARIRADVDQLLKDEVCKRFTNATSTALPLTIALASQGMEPRAHDNPSTVPNPSSSSFESPPPTRPPAKRQDTKPSPETAAKLAAAAMPPPPPRRSIPPPTPQRPHASSRPALPAARAAALSSRISGASSDDVLKRLRKKVREAERLIAIQHEERSSREEREKMAQIDTWRQQLKLLELGTPQATPPRTPGSAASSARTERAVNAGKAAAVISTAHEELDALPSSPKARPGTRARAADVAEQLAREEERAELVHARAVAQAAAREAEAELWTLLHAPFDSWDDEVVWQLVMCEYALVHLDDVASTPKQLQLDFREACEMARHPCEVPRLRGSLQIDALQDALDRSCLLRDELERQLERYKRLYSSLLSGFGRFREVKPQPGETLPGETLLLRVWIFAYTHEFVSRLGGGGREPNRPPHCAHAATACVPD